MRIKSLHTILILALLSIAEQSCKKKNQDADVNSNTNTTTSAVTPTNTAALVFAEGSTSFTADSAKAVLYTSSDVGGPRKRKIDVYGFKNGQQIMEMHFKPQLGTQPVAQNFESAWLTYMTNNGNTYPDDYYNCSSGNFELSLCDTLAGKLSGTFSFTAGNGTVTKSITAGALTNISIKKQ